MNAVFSFASGASFFDLPESQLHVHEVVELCLCQSKGVIDPRKRVYVFNRYNIVAK